MHRSLELKHSSLSYLTTKQLVIRFCAFISILFLNISFLQAATITSNATGNWSATAWPNTARTGTITTSNSSTAVVGVGTSFLTQISIGSIIKTTGNVTIGTVASITDNTNLTFAANAASNNSGIAFNFQGVGAGDDAVVALGTTVTIDGNFTCNTLAINGGNSASGGLTFTGTNSLAVTGATTITGPTNNTQNRFIQVDAGSFSTTSITMSDGGGDTRDCYLRISSGSATVSGAITMNASNLRNYILFTGTGTLFIGGNFGGTTGGGITSTAGGATTGPTSGTVNYNGTGAQTISAFNYYNLTISGARTTNNVTLVNGSTIGISGTYTASATFSSGNYVTTGNTIDFNGTTTQAIPAFNYNNLTISGNKGTNNVTLINGGTIGLAGTFSTTATNVTYVTTGNTFNYNNSGAQNVTSFTYNNLTISGGNTKTMQGAVTVNGILNLSNGKLSLGSSTYDLTIGTSGSIAGSFDNTHMIVCDGTGALIKQSTTAAGFVMTYPVGTNTSYTPMVLSSLTATLAGTETISVRSIASVPSGANTTDLTRYWDVNTSSGLTGIVANVNFTYINPTDVGSGGVQSTYEPAFYSSSWLTPDGASVGGVNPFSSTGTAVLDGYWTAREPVVTFYSYQSGNWSTASSWTTDPSGTLYVNSGSAVPGTGDRVVILNGRTITTSASRTVNSLQINEGGTLDIGTSTGHNFGTVSGQGKLVLSTATFPSGTFTSFVAADGGTVEMKNSSNFNFTGQFTFNNLILNLSTSSIVATLINSTTLTVNGDFTVTKGKFQINDASSTTARTVTIYGDITVSSSGTIQLGAGIANHTFNVKGDFTNNGTVDFYSGSSADYPGAVYSTTAHADVEFNSTSQDQALECNGYSEFYRIGVKKGTDWTYNLTIEASSSSNFYLYGLNNSNTPASDGADNLKALGLTSGTLTLGQNISIPSLTYAPSGSTYDYKINSIAQLVIDGASVSVASSAMDMGVAVYGKLVVNSGTFDATNSRAGIFLRSSSNFTITGGTLNATQLRTSNETGIHRGTVIMSGGTINLTTNSGNLGWADNSRRHATFSLAWPDNVFTMSGGIINIQGSTSPYVQTSPAPSGTGGYNYSMVIGANANNVSITGGTINITIPTDRPAYITSTAPFWNLNVIGTNGTYVFGVRNFVATTTPTDVAAQPLVVYNDFTLTNGAIFDNTTNTQNVTVGENFTINTGTTYSPSSNTTTFNGTSAQTFTASGTITSNLQNVTLSNTSDLTLSGNNITINGTLTIGSGCTLRDNGYTIFAQGNIVNSGTHFKPVSGAGSIQLTSTAAQVLSGDGNGSFNNLTLNKTGGSVTASAVYTINGNLRLAGTAASAAQRWSTLNIGSNKLTLGSSAAIYSDLASGVTFNNYKMIQTSGYMTDDGLCRTYSGTTGLLFPFGFYNTANTTYYYLPATIQYSSAPTAYGTVTSRPANGRHYLAQSTNSLACYWRTSSSGFTGVPTGTVVNQYNYVDAGTNLFIGSGSTETNYIPGVYRNGSSWVTINDVNKVDDGNNYLLYDTAYTADGDYTAGEPATFTSIPVLYSVANGNWNNANTWSTTSGGTPGNGGTPTSTTIVYIVNSKTVTTTASASAGSLYIESGSTLDLGTVTGHNFAALPDRTVTGAGTLRIASTNYFPQGDFGDFIGSNGGTVEYYTNGGNITIPITSNTTGLSLVTYKNLKLSPSTGYNITLPLTNVTVYGNVTVAGTGTGASEGVRTPATSYTYTINGNLTISSGLMEYRNGVIQTIAVLGNISIANGAIFRANSSGTVVNNVLQIYGNLANSGTFDMNNTGIVYTYFKGTTNDTISGSGATYDFYNLTVDKGTDRTAILSLQSNVTTGSTNPFLTLSNGTFRLDNSSLNVTISTTSAFSVPTTACFSVNQGTATIGTTNDAGDLSLSGRLEVLGGTLNIGSTTGYNNDIEYASAGTPTIYVTGGNLNVKGQIRRSTTIASGALNYYQSSGTVSISGNNNQATRAKFELLNDNSSFIMSGGTLNILSASGTSFGDVYLRPDTSSVTGGTIQIGDATSTANQTYTVSSSSDLWNLGIGTSSVSQYYSLSSLPLTVQNDLTINGNSQFLANGFDVEIGGTLTNSNSNASSGTSVGGYQPGSSTQTTTFNGTSSQSISGSGSNLTNFANLVVDKTGTLTLSSNSALRVNTDLTLTSGTLADGGNTITLIGDVDNSASHTSSSTSGGISFSGSAAQTLSGSGSGIFGNIILNNANGVTMTDNSVINGQITFTSGSLYIDDYLLTLGTNATIAGTASESRMIILNGVLSDQGVKKYFATGNTAAFTYPIGISGKYTPVTYDFSANTASNAYITIKPVNALHKSVTTTPTNYIPYYWGVVSSGLSSFTVDQKYYYDAGDILGSEASFTAEKYTVATNAWTNLGNVAGGFINTTGHYINIAGVTYMDGEYTAGEAYTSQPKLYSIASGNWNSTSIWSTTSGGTSCSCSPNGNPVVISSGHTVTLSANSANAYSTLVTGILDVGTTTFHDLGHVDGTGKIIVTSTTDGMYVFPGGEYDNFLTGNTQSTIEFTGTVDATLPLKPGNYYKPYNNIILSGTGVKYMSAENMRIRGNLNISSGTVLNNTLYNKNLYLSGDWTDANTTVDGFVPGTGQVVFEGTSLQHFNASRSEKFYNFTINNATGMQFSGTAGLDVSKYLYLTSGIIYTAASVPLTISNTSTSAIVGASSSSYIDGPLSKNIISGQSFVFPLGSSGRYGEMSLISTSVSSSPQYWTATYHNANPSPTYGTASGNLSSPVTSVSNNEYWAVSRPSGGTARVKLRWDASSYASYTSSSTLRSKLRIVEYEAATTLWTERSTSSGVSGNSSAGTITTTSSVSNNDFIFTLGVSGVTATITDVTSAAICNNGTTVSVPVTLTGTSPWTLTYRTTGSPTNNYTQTGITSSSYNIQLTGSDICGTSNGVFVLSLVSVSDASASGICNASTKQITVNQTYTPDISGLTTVGSSEIHAYSTTSHASSTYAWTWTSTSGGTFSTSTSNPSNITFTATPGTYNLQLAETYSGCTATDIQPIVVQSVPAPSISPTTANVCINDIVTYTTTSNTGHYYNWTVTNGTCTGCGSYIAAASGGNSISVTWSSSGSGTVAVTEATDISATVTGSDSKNYSISAAISSYTATSAASSVCSGSSTNINLSGSQVGITYQLRNSSTHANIGGTTAGSGSAISLSTGALSSTTSFEVYAYNSGCNLTMSGTPSVTVNSLPTANLTSSDADNTICTGTSVTFTATAGNTTYNFFVNGGSVQNTASNTYTTSALANSDQVTVTATLSGCSTTSSAITNTVNAAVSLSVGAAGQTCGTSAYTVSGASVSNYNSLVWSHNGAGSITGSTGITPTYTPVAGDIGNTVGLTITVTALTGCSNANGTKNITINQVPSTSTITHD